MSKLSAALEECMNEKLETLEQRASLADEHIFSRDFDKAMKKIMSKADRAYVRVGRHRVRKALLIACILVLMFAMAMSVSAIRKPFIDMIVHYNDLSSDIEFVQDEESDVNIPWTFIMPEAPEGYAIILEDKTEGDYDIEYKNEDGAFIYYSQMDAETVGLGVNTEDTNATELELNGYKVLETSKYGTNTITWTDGVYAFIIVGTCDMSTLEDMMKGIK